MEVAANSSFQAIAIQTLELLGDRDPRGVVLQAVLRQQEEVLDSKEYYFAPFKELELPQVQISVKEVPDSEGTVFILESNKLARQVWLSAEVEGIFSDNFFDLIPGVPITVNFRRRSNGDEAFVTGSPGKLTVKSMADFVVSDK
ncbi:hypothetical protein D3C74_298550 [compost metagenome]